MNDNIIPFRPQSKRPDALAAERMHQNRDRLRLKQIVEACKKEKAQLRFAGDDAARAGKALYELKEEFLTRRGQVAEAKKHFEKLHRFIVSDDFPTAEEMAAKAKTMTQKVGGYLDAAKAIAKAGNAAPDECQMRCLRGTALWQHWNSSTAKREKASPASYGSDHVAWLLEAMAKRVVRDTRLDELLARMRRVPAQYNISTREFENSSMAALFQTAYQAWFAFYGEAPPLPSVPLVRIPHRTWLWPVRLTREGSGHPYDDDVLDNPVSETEGVECRAEVILFREIRLALGPTVNATTIAPMFESRPCLEITTLNSEGEPVRSSVVRNVYDAGQLTETKSFAVSFDNNWHRFTPLPTIEKGDVIKSVTSVIVGEDVADWEYWSTQPLSDDKNCVEHYYISWTAVDGSYVQHWLERISGDAQPIEPMPDVAPLKNPKYGTWFPRPYIGNHVEVAVNDGRLESALRDAIEHIRSSFDKYEANWRSSMQAQTADQISEFESDLRAAEALLRDEQDISDE